MQEQPLVSIITVVKDLFKNNRVNYFRQAVSSVQMQDYPNIEHLIIDGASTDGTVELLQQMKLNYISEPDSGIHDAVNKGFRLAKGKYIIILCSDDFYISPSGISDSVNVLENSSADFSYSSNYVLTNDNIKKYLPHFNNCFFSHPTATPGIMWKKECLMDLNLFNEKYKIASDFDLLIRALLSGKQPIYCDNCFLVFRLGGISSSNNTKNECIKIMEENFDISHEQATISLKYGFLPKSTLRKILLKTKNFPDVSGLIKQNRKNFIKFLRKQLFELRTRKGKRCFRLFGITFYQEEKL